MAILSIFRDMLPNRVVQAFSWVSGSCSSIGSTVWNLRQKTHNIFRSFLLRSIEWLEAGAQRTEMMRQVEELSSKSFKVFGSQSSEASELNAMIANVRARVLLDREKQRAQEAKKTAETHRSFSRGHDICISTLAWLEKGQVTEPLPENIHKIDTKITEMWKTKTEDYSALELQTSITLAQARVETDPPQTFSTLSFPSV